MLFKIIPKFKALILAGISLVPFSSWRLNFLNLEAGMEPGKFDVGNT